MALPRTNFNLDQSMGVGSMHSARSSYLEYFGLKEEPFGATADPRFLFMSFSHREALASLLHSIHSGRGFMSLIADPGMGKTTLLSEVLERTRRHTESVFLFQTQCSRVELLRYLLKDSGIEPESDDTVTLFAQFQDLLLRSEQRGKNFLLVIDEAQNLSDEVLETIRLLSNFERAQGKLVQIVLAGQTQLGDALSRPENEQLRQRMAVVCRLKALEHSEVEQYVQHRLMVAGRQLPPLFTSEAVARIATRSRGVPRIINNHCFNVLSLAWSLRQQTITSDFVDHAAREIECGLISDETLSTRLTAARPESFSDRPPAITLRKPQAMPHAVGSSKRPVAKSAPSFSTAFAATDLKSRREPISAANHFDGSRTIGITAMVLVSIGLCIAALWIGLQKTTTPNGASQVTNALPLTNPLPQSGENTPTKTEQVGIEAQDLRRKESKLTQKSIPSTSTSSRHPLEVANGRRFEPEVESPPMVEPPQVIASSAIPTLSPNVIRPPKRFEPTTSAPPSTVVPATLIRRIEPRYPKQTAIEGVVQLTATVNDRGQVEHVKADSGPAALVQAAVAAVEQWQYAPATVNGAPVKSSTQVTVKFRRSGQ
jgi:general secretion pathway protein A